MSQTFFSHLLSCNCTCISHSSKPVSNTDSLGIYYALGTYQWTKGDNASPFWGSTLYFYLRRISLAWALRGLGLGDLGLELDKSEPYHFQTVWSWSRALTSLISAPFVP